MPTQEIVDNAGCKCGPYDCVTYPFAPSLALLSSLGYGLGSHCSARFELRFRDPNDLLRYVAGQTLNAVDSSIARFIVGSAPPFERVELFLLGR